MMLKAVPLNVFFAKKTTRGQIKSETDRAAVAGNMARGTNLKSNSRDVGLKKRDAGERQLRSAKQTSKTTNKPAVTSPSDHPSNTTHNLRTRKNAKEGGNVQECSSASVRASRPTPSKHTSRKSVETQPKDKHPVYKQAKLELPSAGVSVEDEYEFQVETPEGVRKKPKKRQPRLKNTMHTIWGLKVRTETKKKLKPSSKVTFKEPENVKPVNKIQATSVSKDLVQFAKKIVAPLQVRTGNTLCPIEIAGVVSAHDNHRGILEGKKNADKGTSESSSKCVHQKYKQTDEEVKENIFLVKKKTSDSPGSKKFEAPIKERLLRAHSNSTPMRNNTSPAINNMSVILSPIRGDFLSPIRASQSVKSTPRNTIHASTPVQSNLCSKLSDEKGNRRSKNQISISIPAFPQSTLQSDQKEKPSREYQNTQNTSANSDFDDVPPNLTFKTDVPNDGSRRFMLPNSENPLQQELHSRNQSSKIVPVPQAPSTWRLGSTVRYNFNFNPNIDNCFGFDEDDIDLIGVIQPNQFKVANLLCSQDGCQHVKKPGNQFHQRSDDQSLKKICPQPEKEQAQKRPCNLSQTKISAQLVQKSLNKKTVSTFVKQTGHEKLPSCDIQVAAAPPEQDIDDLLSSSLNKLRVKKKKKAEDSFLEEITSEDHIQPTSSSQLSHKESDENMTSSKQLPTLFDDIEKDDLFKSSFSEPPRRSYACVRPKKRLALEEDEEENADEVKKKKQTRTKRNKTVYKRKKMVQTTLLDQWAKELSSHFAEVDDTDLLTE